MTEDSRSDEQLVEAYVKGDGEAINILLKRYLAPILSYLFSLSFFKDAPFLDDIRQEVLISIFNGIINEEFTPAGDGSFKRWVYKLTYFACLNADKKRRKGLKMISEVFPESEGQFPDEVFVHITPRTSDFEAIEEKLADALSKLSPDEQKLMRMVSQGVPYDIIQKEPEFAKYSLDYLMLMVYRIRKKLARHGEA